MWRQAEFAAIFCENVSPLLSEERADEGEGLGVRMTKIGVLGAGQLGRMLALAGIPLGIRFRFLDPTPDSPASHLAEQLVGDYNDQETLKRFADGLDAVTYEFENVPVETARFLAQSVRVAPSALALERAQDRLVEKTFFQEQDISTPPFAKSGRARGIGSGYRPNRLARRSQDAAHGLRRPRGRLFCAKWEIESVPGRNLAGKALILEGFVPFDRELSLLAVRGLDGSEMFYPLVENLHREGILRLSIAPAPDVSPEMQAQAEDYARRVLTATDYAGVLAIEFFERTGGTDRQ